MKLRALRTLSVLVLVLGLAACSGGEGATESDATSTHAQDSAAAATEAAGDDGVELEESSAVRAGSSGGGTAGMAPDQFVAQDAATAEEGAAATSQPPVEPLPDSPPLQPGDRIIKEGTVTIEVEPNAFDQSFGGVVAAARRYGGDVIASSTRTNEEGDTFGSVTVRVPVRSFEDLVVGVGEIGTIRHRDIDSQDVSAEFTDLESRLRHLRAQERFYLELLDRARTVNDAISVQQQLDGIQSQIEQIQGRLNLLDDRTSFSTLTVELFEPGTGAALATEDDPEATPTLAGYWQTARNAFVNVIGTLLVAGLFLLPLMIVAGALLVGWKLLRPAPAGRKGAATPSEREPESVGS